MNAPRPALPLVSLIVSTYNRPDALRASLDGCLAQTDAGYEVLVADDGSGDETARTIEQAGRHAPVPVTHVWHEDQGFRLAAIRNQACLRARGAYLIFLDGDCVPQPDFVARHRALARPRTLVTGSRILLGPELTRRALATGLALARQSAAFWLAQRARGQSNKWLPLLAKLPDFAGRHVPGFVWRGIKGCNMAMARADLEGVNGFDQGFEGWGHEDADLVVRLHNAGVARKKGFYATEVLHLWHPENARATADMNRARVLERLAQHIVRAPTGLAETDAARARVRVWNPEANRHPGLK